MSVFRVAIENVTPIWDQAEPLVARALRGRPTHDSEDVRRLLMAQAAHLWVQWDAPIVQAVVVGEFAAYPKGVWLRAWLAGARPDCVMDDDALLDALTGWAQQHRCAGFEAQGRHGWLRRFPGAVAEGLMMRVAL